MHPAQYRIIADGALPVLLTVRMAIQVSGLSKSELYRRLAAEEIEARKIGRSTMVVTASLLQFLERLPRFGH